MKLLELFFATSEYRYREWLEEVEERNDWLAGMEQEARGARLRRQATPSETRSEGEASPATSGSDLYATKKEAYTYQ